MADSQLAPWIFPGYLIIKKNSFSFLGEREEMGGRGGRRRGRRRRNDACVFRFLNSKLVPVVAGRRRPWKIFLLHSTRNSNLQFNSIPDKFWIYFLGRITTTYPPPLPSGGILKSFRNSGGEWHVNGRTTHSPRSIKHEFHPLNWLCFILCVSVP